MNDCVKPAIPPNAPYELNPPFRGAVYARIMAFHGDQSGSALAGVLAAVCENVTGLFAPDSRFFLPYLLTAFGLAYVAFRINRARLPERRKTSFAAYIFDPTVYLNASSLVDLKVVIANRLFTPFLAAAGRAAIVLTATAVATAMVGADALTTSRPATDLSAFALIGVTLVIMLASDFTTYWVHRLHHENPVFWPFHKLHHSAETLTPLTFARKHPVYDLFRALSNAVLLGPVQGVVFALFGVTDVMVILGVNAVYAVFHWTGSNLRHSHVWLSYGRFWSHIFISPAQHQIHHSCAPEHHDKNYGEVFALWDWLFGTLYTPDAYEELTFGVADPQGRRLPQAHPSLKEAWLVPFKESAKALRDREAVRPALTGRSH